MAEAKLQELVVRPFACMFLVVYMCMNMRVLEVGNKIYLK